MYILIYDILNIKNLIMTIKKEVLATLSIAFTILSSILLIYVWNNFWIAVVLSSIKDLFLYGLIWCSLIVHVALSLMWIVHLISYWIYWFKALIDEEIELFVWNMLCSCLVISFFSYFLLNQPISQ